MYYKHIEIFVYHDGKYRAFIKYIDDRHKEQEISIVSKDVIRRHLYDFAQQEGLNYEELLSTPHFVTTNIRYDDLLHENSASTYRTIVFGEQAAMDRKKDAGLYNYFSDQKEQKRKVRITALVAAVITALGVGTYSLVRRNNAYNGKVVTAINLDYNKVPSMLKTALYDMGSFSNILTRIINEDYDNLKEEDIDKFDEYLTSMITSSFEDFKTPHADRQFKYSGYKLNFGEFFDKNSAEYDLVNGYTTAYNGIISEMCEREVLPTALNEKAYFFCQNACSTYIDNEPEVYYSNGKKKYYTRTSVSSVANLLAIKMARAIIETTGYSHHNNLTGGIYSNKEILKILDELMTNYSNNLKIPGPRNKK